MKYLKLLILPLWLFATAFRVPAPTTYLADKEKSQIKWTGYAEAGGYAPSGTVKVKTGTLQINKDLPVAGKIVIDLPTLSQSNKEMEEHLKGKDFFDVATYPEATFVLTGVKGNMINGSLTIKGITRLLSVPLTVQKTNDGVLIKATLKIDRTKFDIKYNSKSYFQDLGNYAIKNEFDLDISLECHPA